MEIKNKTRVKEYITKLVNSQEKVMMNRENSQIKSLKEQGLWDLGFAIDNTFKRYASEIDSLIETNDLENEESPLREDLINGKHSIIKFIEKIVGFTEFHSTESSISKTYLGYDVNE